MRRTTFRTAITTVLLLTACSGGTDAAPSMVSMAARNGARWTHEILTTGVVKPMPPPRPSAMLGPYVAAFLSLPLVEISHSSVSGVLAGTSILFADRGVRDDSYALLEELGLALQVNLKDQLNRALDRGIALDAYRDGLVDVASRAQDHLTNELERRQDDADAKVREVRSQASDVQRNLNAALRAKDYATAGSLQAEASQVQGELAVATAQQREIRDIIGLFEDSLDAAAERVAAIDANRDALIAGVSVTDVAGADDLGVLQDAPRGRRRADPEEVFGPTNSTR